MVHSVAVVLERDTKEIFPKKSTATEHSCLTMDISDDAYNALRASLLNESGNTPLHERFRALFTLKSLKNERAIEIISEGNNFTP